MELEIVPHPALKHPETIAMDYCMQEGMQVSKKDKRQYVLSEVFHVSIRIVKKNISFKLNSY